MKATVRIVTSVEERGVNKLTEIAEVVESIVRLESFELEDRAHGSGQRAVFKGETDLTLAAFTAKLYGASWGKTHVRDVSYHANQSIQDAYNMPAPKTLGDVDPDFDERVTG
jgi:hypothetical protein